MSQEKSNNSEALTTYLTKEVELHTNLLLAQRTKNNLIFSIAPFLALGVIASNAKLLASLKQIPSTKFAFFIAFVLLVFMFLGFIGAKIEEKLWEQCNQWRRQIAKLHDLHGEEAFEFNPNGLLAVYLCIFGSVGVLFSALLYFIKVSVE